MASINNTVESDVKCDINSIEGSYKLKEPDISTSEHGVTNNGFGMFI